MKRYVYLVIFLLSALIDSKAQAYRWEWAEELDSTGYQVVHDMVLDSVNHHVYVVGGFDNNLSLNYGGDAAYGGKDGFVSKFDTLGVLQWSFNIGGLLDDEIKAIDIDYSNQRILITGYVTGGLVNFKGVTGNDSFMVGYSGKDVLIASYNFQGELDQQQLEGGSGDDIGNDILVIPGRNIFVYTGEFYSQMELISGGIDTGPNDGNTHMFCASRYVNNNRFNWRSYSEGDYQIGRSIVAYGDEVFIIGDYENSMRVNTFHRVDNLNTVFSNDVSSILTNGINTQKNIFCGRYKVTTGVFSSAFNWRFSIYGPGNELSGAINIKGDKLYVGGAVSDNVIYGSSAPDLGVVGQEAFVSVHDLTNNNALIGKVREPNIGATTKSIINAIDFTDRFMVTGGKTSGTIRFGGNPLNDLINSGGNTEGFAAFYNPDSTFCEIHEVDGVGANSVNTLQGFGRNIFVGGAYGKLAKLDNDLTMNSGSDDESGFISLLLHRDCKPNIEYAFDSICSESPSFLPSFIEDTVGKFSEVGSGLTLNPLTGMVTPYSSSGGNHQIVYTPFKGCSDTFDLHITKGIVPSFNTQPQNITLYTSSTSCTSNYLYAAPTYSLDCGDDTLKQVDLTGFTSGDNFPLGVTEQVYILTDGYNPNDTATFNVTLVDNVSPVILCQGDTTVYSSSSTCDAFVDIDVFYEDNCTSPLTLVQTGNTGQQNNSSFPVSDTPYILDFSVTDGSGNASTCSVEVIVSDTVKPTFSNCPSGDTITAYSSISSCSKMLDFSNLTYFDACGLDSISKTFNGVPSSSNLFPLDTTKVVYRIEDFNNNVSTCEFTVIIKDLLAPTFTNCPTDTIKLYVSEDSCTKEVEFDIPEAIDNCDFRVFQDFGFVSGAERAIGIDTLIFRALDSSGNSATCTIIYSIIDSISPLLNCPNDTLLNADIQLCGLGYSYADFTGADNCTLSTSNAVQIDQTGLSSGSVFPLGQTLLEYELFDVNMNSTTCSFNIEVVNIETIEFNEMPNGICIDSDSLKLSDFISGNLTGDFYIDGVLGESFYPSLYSDSATITYKIGQGNCTDSITHFIRVHDFSAEAGDSIMICGLSSKLEGNNIPNSTSQWVQISNESYNPNNLVNPNVVSESQQGDYFYVWQVSKDQCVKSDTVFVSFYEQPYVYAGENITVDESQVDLNAELGLGSGVWSVLSSEGVIEDSLDYGTNVSNLNLGLNTFTWTVSNGVCPIDSSVVRIFYDKLTLPNAFTPNGDGVNDVFKIEGFELYSDAELTILDRWGELIFYTEESNEYWNGTYKGKEVVEDTYFYILFINGEEYTGYIELRR
jgi:gliding motility-associated-like protein